MVFGYFAHLLEDSFSQGGIIWLYSLMPYDRKMWQKYHVIINRRCEKYLRFFVDIYTKNIYTNYSQKERINKNEV